MKFRSILYGIGKAGNIVGRTGKGGEYIISAYQPNVHNPRTTAQQMVRDRAKVVVQSLKFFTNWAKFMVKPSGKRTYWTELIKLNLDEAVTGTYPNYSLDYAQVTIANGNIDLPYSPTASNDNTTLSLTWADNTGMGNANADDKLCIAVFNPTKQALVYNLQLAERSERNASYTLPTAWVNDTVEVWIAMRSLAGEPSKSTHVATISL